MKQINISRRDAVDKYLMWGSSGGFPIPICKNSGPRLVSKTS
jgi:hypothetical protein